MVRNHTLLPAAALVAAVSYASPARSDVPPPDSCAMGAVGNTCNNAGPSANEPGICTNETCSHALPSADGGFMTVQYACVLCEPTGAVDGGSGNGGKGSGCSMATGASALAPLALFAASALLSIARRKRDD